MRILIQALATATPPLYVTQREAFAFFDAHLAMAPEERELFRRILLDGPVRGRYIGMDRPEEALEADPDRLIARFGKFGRSMAAVAARAAMAQAGCAPADIGGVVVNTCTGYLCPGLSSYVAEDLGLEPGVKVMDLMGMGCGAALPNLECAAGFVARGAAKPILSIAVEVCSATIFLGAEPDLIVSNCIFGDGASAALVGGGHDGGARPADRGLLQILDFESGIFPAHREQLRYRSQQGRLRNVLSPRVPVLGAMTITHVVERLLARNGLSPKQVAWWAVHAGGTAVLKQVGKKLGLDDEALRFSHEVFREYGNMSSPTVMFVLKKIIDQGRPQPGEPGLLLSFGAGFAAFGALVAF
ncbi:MAG: 3-oxoacyl-[acyl-carrier-protein] synthase III C-terminal domain-containing protein [Desulfobacteraceae bacterium]|jgi:alkylresorcinol/alkylpyrone synthase